MEKYDLQRLEGKAVGLRLTQGVSKEPVEIRQRKEEVLKRLSFVAKPIELGLRGQWIQSVK